MNDARKNVCDEPISLTRLLGGGYDTAGLVQWAQDYLESGHDSPNLRILAGMSMYEISEEIVASFEGALSELGIHIDQSIQGRMERTIRYASLIASDAIRDEEDLTFICHKIAALTNYDLPHSSRPEIDALKNLEIISRDINCCPNLFGDDEDNRDSIRIELHKLIDGVENRYQCEVDTD